MIEPLRSLTYVSRPTQPMPEMDVRALAAHAARLNALDGITGLLVFNGARFCQTVEGAEGAIEDLLGRLRRDPRHADLRIIADEQASERRFRSWDMQLLLAPGEERAALDLARARLDSDLDVAARARLYATVEGAFA